MNEIFAFLRTLLLELKPWQIVQPWEAMVRTRCGRWIRVTRGGTYLKLPVIDCAFVESNRPRWFFTGRQVVETAGGEQIYFQAALLCALDDVLAWYQRANHADDYIVNMVRSVVARRVAECGDRWGMEEIAALALPEIADELRRVGLRDFRLTFTEYARIPVVRLIGDAWR